MENTQSATITDEAKLSFDRFRAEVLKDYEIACISQIWHFWRWKRDSPNCNGEVFPERRF